MKDYLTLHRYNRLLLNVLGDAAKDEIIYAWGKAYSYISDALIDIEKSFVMKQHQARFPTMLQIWNQFDNFVLFEQLYSSLC